MCRAIIILCAIWCGANPPDLDELAARLADPNPQVRRQAAGDLLNGEYRDAPPDKLLHVLVESLKEPAPSDPDAQSARRFVMEHLAGRFGPKAGAALPYLLRMVTDDKLSSYLRGNAIQTSAQIAPGDPRVVAALIAALENPNPKTQSGVHDHAIAWLGVMGKAAWPAKKAVAKMLEHPWYQDGAFIALGKLALAGETLTAEAALQRLADVDRPSVEDASAAFLRVAEEGKKRRHFAEQARPVLWSIVAMRGNDVISRAALRTLIEVGPGSSAESARTLVRCLFTKWDPKQGSISALAEAALDGFEAKDKDAAAVLAEAFAQSLKQPDQWTHPRTLARTLARFGPDAAPAAPHVSAALRNLPEYQPSGYGRDLLEAYTELAAVIGAEPGVRAAVLELLGPDSKLLKTSGAYRWAVESRLLLTLGRQGLPADGAERTQALTRIGAGLKGAHRVVFPAAARVVRQNPRLRPDEVRELLPPLTHVLAFDFKFAPDAAADAQGWMATFQDREPLVEGQRAAIQALAALGPSARNALPTLHAWAKRPLEKRVSDFLPEPAVNLAIREAVLAIKAIQPGERE
jgi:HEAT repeat protein